MIETVDLSIQKMKKLLEKLSIENTVEKPSLLSIDKLLHSLVKEKSKYEPKPILDIKDKNISVFSDFYRLERAIGHLIQNSIEATSRNGEIRVNLMKKGNSAIIEITDTGHGMSKQFIREKLFRPFESTKSSGMGIGVFESREYICELGGQLKVISSKSDGTVFHIVLPLYRNTSTLKMVNIR